MTAAPLLPCDGAAVFLADGAMGTNLHAAGLAADAAPERWLMERPKEIAAVHRAFVAAGSDVVLTCSFGANAVRLDAWGAGSQVFRLNERAAALAREAADRAPRPMLVAGSVGPTWRSHASDRSNADDELTAIFAEQIAGLRAGGIDLVWMETMVDAAEARAAAQVAIAAGLPYVATASFGRNGTTPAALTPAGFAAAFDALAVPPITIGSNCCDGPDTALASAAAMQPAPGIRLAVKPNCGLPRFVDGRATYPEGRHALAAFAEAALAHGATIIGGCCGATPAHIAAMRRVIDARCDAL